MLILALSISAIITLVVAIIIFIKNRKTTPVDPPHVDPNGSGTPAHVPKNNPVVYGNISKFTNLAVTRGVNCAPKEQQPYVKVADLNDCADKCIESELCNGINFKSGLAGTGGNCLLLKDTCSEGTYNYYNDQTNPPHGDVGQTYIKNKSTHACSSSSPKTCDSGNEETAHYITSGLSDQCPLTCSGIDYAINKDLAFRWYDPGAKSGTPGIENKVFLTTHLDDPKNISVAKLASIGACSTKCHTSVPGEEYVSCKSLRYNPTSSDSNCILTKKANSETSIFLQADRTPGVRGEFSDAVAETKEFLSAITPGDGTNPPAETWPGTDPLYKGVLVWPKSVNAAECKSIAEAHPAVTRYWSDNINKCILTNVNILGSADQKRTEWVQLNALNTHDTDE